MLELWETAQFIENNILMWFDATFSETKKNPKLFYRYSWELDYVQDMKMLQ